MVWVRVRLAWNSMGCPPSVPDGNLSAIKPAIGLEDQIRNITGGPFSFNWIFIFNEIFITFSISLFGKSCIFEIFMDQPLRPSSFRKTFEHERNIQLYGKNPNL